MTTGTLTRLVASPINYWLGFVLDGGVALSLIGAGFLAAPGAVAPFATLGVGAIAYSFYEYAFHRWLFHRIRSPMHVVHALHHREPRALIGAPFFFSLGVCALTFALAWCVAGTAIAATFAGSVLLAHMGQSAVHHVCHSTRPTRRFRSMRRRHMLHHRRGDVNFGITTTMWDRWFRTDAGPRAS